jgi:hypothetical protein
LFAKKQLGSLHLKCNRQAGQCAALRFFTQRQQAIGRHAFVRHHAEEPARRQAGITRKHLEITGGGKPLAEFPGIDGGNRQTQILRNFLQGNVVLSSPCAERSRKTRAEVAVEI